MRVTGIASLILLISVCTAQEPPRAGAWVTGPRGNPHDLVPDAVTIGQFTMGGRLMGDATVFLACKGNSAAPPVLELRFIVKPFPGFRQETQAATMTIDTDKYPVSLDSFPVQNQPFFIIQPGPAESKKIASIEENQSARLSVEFKEVTRPMGFGLDLRPPAGPVAIVLNACQVAIPATLPPLPPVSAQELTKYVIEGIRLGMSKQQVIAAARAAGVAGPIIQGPGGGLTFKTPDLLFSDIAINDRDQVEHVAIHGLPSRTAKFGVHSGPLYALAVKNFGPPTSMTSDGAKWGGDPSHPIAQYFYAADEEPTGNIMLSAPR